ncbi:DUF1294 domain-containing protein [Sanguibacter sp. 25GB23B1]|uniref:DUF1294 domain-containing protein n=1 Tax=unclassified Sanguibacter TaxID=2645534 RepID=UPI0032AF28E9
MPRSPLPAGRPPTSRPRPGSTAAARPPRRRLRPWAPVVAFLVVSVTAAAMDLVPWWLVAVYGVMSVVCFAAYASDKRSARADRRRVPERTLLDLGLLCGWPGAIVAQQLLRHKTVKQSFRSSFWRTVVVNILLVALLVSPIGRTAIENLREVVSTGAGLLRSTHPVLGCRLAARWGSIGRWTSLLPHPSPPCSPAP